MSTNFFSPEWVWLYTGVLLMLAELLAPGFVIFFFGLAAASVAGIKFIFPSISMACQIALFSVFSVIYLTALRKWFYKLFKIDSSNDNSTPSEFAGRFAKVTQKITPGFPGRVMLGDSEWTAEADDTIEAGENVCVIDQKNLTLKVEKV
jgi:membrane protein implicated in regulation of membrane protease activity